MSWLHGNSLAYTHKKPLETHHPREIGRFSAELLLECIAHPGCVWLSLSLLPECEQILRLAVDCKQVSRSSSAETVAVCSTLIRAPTLKRHFYSASLRYVRGSAKWANRYAPRKLTLCNKFARCCARTTRTKKDGILRC